MYLVDEFCGMPSFSSKADESNKIPCYPIIIQPEKSYFQEIVIPFMMMRVMVVTNADGLENLPPSHQISKSWISWICSNLGFLPPPVMSNTKFQSKVIQFATLYNITICESQEELSLLQTNYFSIEIFYE